MTPPPPFLLSFMFCLCAAAKSCLSHVRLFVTSWTTAHQAPLSMEFSRQEYWSGLPFPSVGNLPDPGSNSCLLHWQVDFLLLSHLGSSPMLTHLTLHPPPLPTTTSCIPTGSTLAFPSTPTQASFLSALTMCSGVCLGVRHETLASSAAGPESASEACCPQAQGCPRSSDWPVPRGSLGACPRAGGGEGRGCSQVPGRGTPLLHPLRTPRGFPQKSQCGLGRRTAAPEVGPSARFPPPHSRPLRSGLPQTRLVGLPWEDCLLCGHLPRAVQGHFGAGEPGGQKAGDAEGHLGVPG